MQARASRAWMIRINLSMLQCHPMLALKRKTMCSNWIAVTHLGISYQWQLTQQQMKLEVPKMALSAKIITSFTARQRNRIKQRGETKRLSRMGLITMLINSQVVTWVPMTSFSRVMIWRCSQAKGSMSPASNPSIWRTLMLRIDWTLTETSLSPYSKSRTPIKPKS